jgi:hypothetical protein
VERLAGAGLVEPIYDRDGSVVAITRHGRRVLGAALGDVPIGVTRTAELAHTRAISWVAAYLTLRGRGWLGERALRREERWRVPVIWPASRSSHRPDLVVLREDGPLAIEVELTLKTPRRLRANLHGYKDAGAAVPSNESDTSLTTTQS